MLIILPSLYDRTGGSVKLEKLTVEEDGTVRDVLKRVIESQSKLKDVISHPEKLLWGELVGCSHNHGEGLWKGSSDDSFLLSFPNFMDLKSKENPIQIAIFLQEGLRLVLGEEMDFKIISKPSSPRGPFCPSPSFSSSLLRSRSPGPYCSRSLSRSDNSTYASSSCPSTSFCHSRPPSSHSHTFPSASPTFVSRSPSPPSSSSSSIVNPPLSTSPTQWRQADPFSHFSGIQLDDTDLSFKKDNYHHFTPAQIMLEPCEVCHKRIFRKALRCGACKILIHPDCQDKVEPCNFNLRRTSLARPDMTQVRGILRSHVSEVLAESPNTARRRSPQAWRRDLSPQPSRRRDPSPQNSRRREEKEPIKRMWTLRDTRWNSRVTYPVSSRTTYTFTCDNYHDPLTSFHQYFSLPHPLEQIHMVDKGKDNQFALEIQEILAFRSRIAQLFKDFDPGAIPEMTASFVQRTPSGEDKLKLVDLKCFAGTDLSKGMKVTLSLDTPIRKLVTKVINYGLLPSINSVEDVVLRRVGRKEFIWQLDNPLICYDFAIEASETRKLLQFSVCSKSTMMKTNHRKDLTVHGFILLK